MASFFNMAGRFGRQPRTDRQPSPTRSHPPPLNLQQQQYQGHFTPNMQSPTTEAAPMAMDNMMLPSNAPPQMMPRSTKPPFFFREENSTLIVKGNFMTLAAQPVHVEKGEWLAHQVVEQYRLLESWIKIVQEKDQSTGRALCNPETCPTMTAAGFIYTWLDKNKEPVKIPAQQYINLVQQWTTGKISNQRLFPIDTNIPISSQGSYPSPDSQIGGIMSGPSTPIGAGPTSLNLPLSTLSGNVDRDWLGKASGFPESFGSDIRNLYRQMFRCYAHLYHNHWVEPFWHLGATKELNTCFIHFVNVGRMFDLLDEKDLSPMQPLVDIWINKGLLPLTAAEIQKRGGPEAVAAQRNGQMQGQA